MGFGLLLIVHWILGLHRMVVTAWPGASMQFAVWWGYAYQIYIYEMGDGNRRVACNAINKCGLNALTLCINYAEGNHRWCRQNCSGSDRAFFKLALFGSFPPAMFCLLSRDSRHQMRWMRRPSMASISNYKRNSHLKIIEMIKAMLFVI